MFRIRSNMSRETTPTKQWADELERSTPNTTPSPNDTTTPKISNGWKRQLLLHAERSKKQAEKEDEKRKKIEEWRNEEKKRVLDAKASPDKVVESTPSPVRSPFSASETRGRGGRSPVLRGSEHPPRSGAPRDNTARHEQRPEYGNRRAREEHKPRQHSDSSPSDKYAPSRRPEVESERWSRGAHSTAHRTRGTEARRGTRGRGREYEGNKRHSPARDHSEEHVDVEAREDSSTRAPTRASTRAASPSQRVVLVVNVELENGARTQLQIHERAEVTRTARDFCSQHGIDAQLIDLFVDEIASHVQSL